MAISGLESNDLLKSYNYQALFSSDFMIIISVANIIRTSRSRYFQNSKLSIPALNCLLPIPDEAVYINELFARIGKLASIRIDYLPFRLLKDVLLLPGLFWHLYQLSINP